MAFVSKDKEKVGFWGWKGLKVGVEFHAFRLSFMIGPAVKIWGGLACSKDCAYIQARVNEP